MKRITPATSATAVTPTAAPTTAAKTLHIHTFVLPTVVENCRANVLLVNALGRIQDGAKLQNAGRNLAAAGQYEQAIRLCGEALDLMAQPGDNQSKGDIDAATNRLAVATKRLGAVTNPADVDGARSRALTLLTNFRRSQMALGAECRATPRTDYNIATWTALDGKSREALDGLQEIASIRGTEAKANDFIFTKMALEDADWAVWFDSEKTTDAERTRFMDICGGTKPTQAVRAAPGGYSYSPPTAPGHSPHSTFG